MPAAYRKTDVFFSAHEQMHEMGEHLRSDTASADDHAELETYVREHGRELNQQSAVVCTE